ncbi:MAG: molybdopterin-dependent oxidoreductase [Halioglobus sp.]
MTSIESAATHHHSVCPLDCADTCSLSIEVADGKVQKVRGSQANPFTRGKICAKVAQGLPHQVHGEQRLTQPLLRSGPKGGGAYRPVSWDEALDVVHERFQVIIEQYGAQAIAPLSYGGPMGLLAGGSMDKRFFNRLGASAVDSAPLCAGVSGAAWDSVFGDVGGIAFTELQHSRLIVVWGNNITACNLHVTTLLRDARKQGAKLVVVDPKRTRIAREADLHLPVIPGTDVVLAYAIAALLERNGGLDEAFIERHVSGAEQFLTEAANYSPERAAAICGLTMDGIRLFAKWWQELSPAAISVGVAPERNRNGGSGLRALFSLPALTGNFGVPGAGVCDVSSFFPVNYDALERPDLAPADIREFNVLDLPRHILDPGKDTPLKGVFIYNHNPVAVHPRQDDMRAALLNEELFVVGSDVSMTDSMACADVILPAATHLEYGDLYKAYGHHYLQRSAPVLDPLGQALPNTEIFRRLAARFGFEEDCFSETDEQLMDQAVDANTPGLDGRRASTIPLDAAADMSATTASGVLRGLAPSTPSGKIELFSAALEKEAGLGLPRYQELESARQFILVSPASERRINSTFGGLTDHKSDIVCEMHPSDAASLALSDGEDVRLFNDQGEVIMPLVISDEVRTGTVFVPKGAWLAGSATGQTINALIPGHKADMAGGACYYDCTVDIRSVC